jgi:hypothetical protein
MDAVQSQVDVVDDYSDTNVMEDKANVGRAIDLPNETVSMLDLKQPIIRKKFITLLARMYERTPEVVQDIALRYGRIWSHAPRSHK